MEASNIAKGRAIGTRVIRIYQSSCNITKVSNPFPIIFSNIFQMCCINNANSEIENVKSKGPKKDLIISKSSFFTNRTMQ